MIKAIVAQVELPVREPEDDFIFEKTGRDPAEKKFLEMETVVLTKALYQLRKAGVAGDITYSRNPPEEIVGNAKLEDGRVWMVAWGESDEV